MSATDRFRGSRMRRDTAAAPDAAEQMHDVNLEALVPVLVEFFAR